MISRCVLANPKPGSRCHCLKAVQSRIRKWLAGYIMQLWSDLLEEEEKLNQLWKKPRRAKPESLRLANAQRACQAVEDGQYRKAQQALTFDGLAQASTEVYKEMLAKHTQDSISSIPPITAPSPLKVTVRAVTKALRSFPSGSAPGPSGIRANHLKEAVFCPSPYRANQALQAVLGVVNLLCLGQVPSEVIPQLCGASLFASRKRGGRTAPHCSRGGPPAPNL